MFTAEQIVFGSLALAFLFVLARAVFMGFPYALGDTVGKVVWKDSWASTLTLAGVILTSTIGVIGDVFPKDASLEPMSKAEFTGMNLLFGLLIITAGILYNAFTTRTEKQESEQKVIEYHGHVVSFLAACTITLWAALGELATTFMLATQIRSGGTTSSVVILVFQVFLVLAGILVLIHAWKNIRWVVQINSETRALKLFASIRGADWAVEGEVEKPAPTEWSLL